MRPLPLIRFHLARDEKLWEIDDILCQLEQLESSLSHILHNEYDVFSEKAERLLIDCVNTIKATQNELEDYSKYVYLNESNKRDEW